MSGFLDELGKRLAERWLTLLVLPGLVYLACAAVAVILGQSHAWEAVRLLDILDRIADRPALSSPGVIVLVAAGILALTLAAGFAASGLGWTIGRLLAADLRGRPVRLLTRRRQDRWNTANDLVQAAIARSVRARGNSSPALARGLSDALAERESISLMPPERPTWVGDRLLAPGRRIHKAYDLDIASAWPRLWLLIPETARVELTAAGDAYTAATRLAAWAVLYLLLTWWWWPACLIAVAVALLARVRVRSAAAVLGDLIEATADLYARDLAAQLGLLTGDTLSRETGLAITIALRKDTESLPAPNPHQP
ncbi:hypothetical protein [Streptomyces sp. NPDC002276]